MNKKKILTSVCATVASAAMIFSATPFASFAARPAEQFSDGQHDCVFVTDSETGFSYWYENDQMQGTISDPKNVWLDNSPRGREIFDPATNGWYWLDADRDGVYAYTGATPADSGAKATSKEVCIPYIFQEDNDLRANQDALAAKAAETDRLSKSSGLGALLIQCINNGEGKWVRYDANGAMIKGWYTEDGSISPSQVGNKYFYDVQTGLMARGWITIEGTKYHFDETTGVLIGEGGQDDSYNNSSNNSSNNGSTGYTVDPADISAIKDAPGLYAIESDVYLSGSGNGYHAKLAISNGGSATVSFGIQYDVNSGRDCARGKCALMIEDATPSSQNYYFPKENEGGLNVGETSGAAHLMLSVNGDSGDYFCFYNGTLVWSGNNSGLIVSDPVNVQIKSEGAADDGSSVVAKFKNTKVKYRYYNQYRIATRGIGKSVYHHVYDGCAFSAGPDEGTETDPWGLGRKDIYQATVITGTNASQDWDVPVGVQAYMHYVEGYGTSDCMQWEKRSFDFNGNEIQ